MPNKLHVLDGLKVPAHVRALRAIYARTIGGKLPRLARARLRTRVIDAEPSPRAFIGQRAFWKFDKNTRSN